MILGLLWGVDNISFCKVSHDWKWNQFLDHWKWCDFVYCIVQLVFCWPPMKPALSNFQGLDLGQGIYRKTRILNRKAHLFFVSFCLNMLLGPSSSYMVLQSQRCQMDPFFWPGRTGLLWRFRLSITLAHQFTNPRD